MFATKGGKVQIKILEIDTTISININLIQSSAIREQPDSVQSVYKEFLNQVSFKQCAQDENKAGWGKMSQEAVLSSFPGTHLMF